MSRAPSLALLVAACVFILAASAITAIRLGSGCYLLTGAPLYALLARVVARRRSKARPIDTNDDISREDLN